MRKLKEPSDANVRTHFQLLFSVLKYDNMHSPKRNRKFWLTKSTKAAAEMLKRCARQMTIAYAAKSVIRLLFGIALGDNVPKYLGKICCLAVE
jgi:hypothetical protein